MANKYAQFSKAHRARAEWHMCRRKRRFNTEREATAAGLTYPNPHGHAYKCPLCKHWHWTAKRKNDA